MEVTVKKVEITLPEVDMALLKELAKKFGWNIGRKKSGIEKLAGFFFSALNKTAGNTAGENRLNSGTSCGIAKSINGKNKLVKSDLNRSKCMA